MAGPAIQEMIGTALILHHHPRDSEKDILQKIAHDSSAPKADHKVAGVLAGIHHTAGDSDKEELKKLQNWPRRRSHPTMRPANRPCWPIFLYVVVHSRLRIRS